MDADALGVKLLAFKWETYRNVRYIAESHSKYFLCEAFTLFWFTIA